VGCRILCFINHFALMSSLYAFIQGETPLHMACQQGLAELTLTLLEKGANPNAQTVSSMSSFLTDDKPCIFQQTPLHLAIANKHRHVVTVFLEYKGNTVSCDVLHYVDDVSSDVFHFIAESVS